jgi:hypothetical protein
LAEKNMGNAMTHNVFKVTADPISCAMLISLAKDGINLGRKSGSAMLIFNFGDSALGIELPQSELQTFGQRLMTLAADEGSAQ